MRFQFSNFFANGVIPAFAIALASFARAQPIEWTKMIWESADLGPRTEEHAALMLEVKLDSQPASALMQLDTGASGNFVYIDNTEPLDPARLFVTLSGTVARRPMQGEQFFRFPFHDPSGRLPLIGTIGLPFFERRILLLDFVAQQIAILDKDETLPAAIAPPLDFVPVEYRKGYRNGKPFVPLSLNGAEVRDLFFDTCSAVTPIATTRSMWSELTGRQPSDPANERITAKSWGRDSAAIGAPLKGEMCIGRTCVAHPLVYFQPSEPDDSLNFSGWISTALFDYRYSIVLDLPHKRLGVYKGSLVELGRPKK